MITGSAIEDRWKIGALGVVPRRREGRRGGAQVKVGTIHAEEISTLRKLMEHEASRAAAPLGFTDLPEPSPGRQTLRADPDVAPVREQRWPAANDPAP